MSPEWRKRYQKAANKFRDRILQLDMELQAEIEEQAHGPVVLEPYTPPSSRLGDFPVWVYVAPRTGRQFYEGGHGRPVAALRWVNKMAPAHLEWRPLPGAVCYDVWVSPWPGKARYYTTVTTPKVTVLTFPRKDRPLPEDLVTKMIHPSIPRLKEKKK
jgi:hypothetical protein